MQRGRGRRVVRFDFRHLGQFVDRRLRAVPGDFGQFREPCDDRRRTLALGQRILGLAAVEPRNVEGGAVGRNRQRGRPVGLRLQRATQRHRRKIPNLNLTILTGRDQRLAVARKGQLEDRRFVGELRNLQRIGVLFRVRAQLPHANPIVDAAGDDVPTVGTERHGVQLFERLRQRVEPGTAGHVPQLDGSIAAGTGQHSGVGPKRQIVNRVVVAGQRAQLGPRGHVPKFDLLIVAAGGQQLAVGAERDAVEAVAVTGEGTQQAAVGHIPEANFSDQTGLARRGHKSTAIGRKGDAGHSAAMTAQLSQFNERPLRCNNSTEP